MKILHFATFENLGGAARASWFLHQGLRAAGCTSKMVVRFKQTQDADVFRVPGIFWKVLAGKIRRRIPRWGDRTPGYTFNFDREPEVDARWVERIIPGEIDFICLHWITHFLSSRWINDLYGHYHKPLVWMMVDQEPVTGGCHYSFDCMGYRSQCGKCPQLHSVGENDRSRKIWQRKLQYLRPLPITFVAPTRWVKARIEESSLFHDKRVWIIPFPIDPQIFHPMDIQAARGKLGLPPGKKIIFFGANHLGDKRKGMNFLSEALITLAHLGETAGGPIRIEDVFLVVAGTGGEALLATLPFAGKALGYLNDQQLSLAYQSADLFACPSIADAGPMMLPEAMMCGTPVVAFNCGGGTDIIRSERNGFLARFMDSEDFARGLIWGLTLPDSRKMREAAWQAVRNDFSLPAVVAKFIELFQHITDGPCRKS